MRDINEKKKLELELAAQKNTFETLFNESVDGLCLLTSEHYLDCNKAFLTLLGFSEKEDIIGLTPMDISPEYQPDGRASKEAAKEVIETAFSKGTIHFDWVHKKADNTQFWCEIIVFRISLNGENVLYAITRDIVDKKALEHEIASQKATFEKLFNESVDGLCLMRGKEYIDCNPAMVEMLGFTDKNEVVGLTPMDVSPSYQPGGSKSDETVEKLSEIAQTDGYTRFEWIHTNTSGKDFWCEIIVIAIVLNGEDVLYAIVRDISEKKNLEIKLCERNTQLNESNDSLERTIRDLRDTQNKLVESEKMASLGSLVAGVAHEINTPVGVGLTGVTQLMEECTDIRKRYQKGQLTETDFEDFLANASEIADIVKKNLDRTAHLVRSFKQVAVDQVSDENREINLKNYFDEVVFSLASVVRKADVTVNITCEDDLNVITNPGLLSQVLTNLIVNSVNHGFYGRNSGTIDMALTEISPTEFVLIYRDDGIGISKENTATIFEPFYTTKRGAGGTGLGLNITYNIVTTALQGKIICNSDIGKGVEFVIQFKVARRID